MVTYSLLLLGASRECKVYALLPSLITFPFFKFEIEGCYGSYKDFQNQKLSNDHAKGTTFGIRPVWGVFFLSLILSSFQMIFLPSSDDEMPVVSVIGEITMPRSSNNQEIFLLLSLCY